MEIFIAFTKNDDFTLLKETLEAWDALEDADLSAIECDPKKFEIARRVAADHMAKKQHYILADLGCVPDSSSLLVDVVKRLTDKSDGPGRNFNDDNAALIGLCPASHPGPLQYPTGVRICEKGAIEKWLPKTTDTYDKEHADSARLAQREVEIWTDIFFKHLRVH